MKLSTRILADELVDEIKGYVAGEIAELKGSAASASRVAELMMDVAQLKERVRVLEERERASKTVKLHAA